MFSRQSLGTIIGIAILAVINLLMVSSLAPHLLLKQLFLWSVGVGLFFIGRQVNPKQSNSTKWTIFFACCLFLLLPLILGRITHGAQRWLDFGLISIQPTELVKPGLMLFLANSNTLFAYLFHLFPTLLIVLQPDLSSSISVFLLIIPVIIHNQKLFKISLLGLLLLALLSPLIWNKGLHDYQRNRILNLLDPQSDPLGQGYNLIQSKIAIGSGGLFGKGYRQGSQGQLLFLPEKHTDFIFAATVEELGFITGAIIIVAYGLIINNLLQKIFSLKDKTHFIFSLGIVIQIWLHVFVNIGMNVGILPVTGLPLPFLSVGGSSLVALLFSLGIIYSS